MEVMGWTRFQMGWGMGDVYRSGDTTHAHTDHWHPDTNIADAWRVVEEMRERGFRMETRDANMPTRMFVRFSPMLTDSSEVLWALDGDGWNDATAICLAALRACGVDEQRIEQARRTT